MWNGLKGGCEKVDGLGSEFWNASGVSTSELLNCEMVWKTVFAELSSESMRGELLVYDGMGEGMRSEFGMLGE